MKDNIALIGFMGAGKSAVGKVLADELDMKFIEMDDLVAKRLKKSIARVFQEDGEAAFRRTEAAVAVQAAKKKHAVIACGGGVILDPANIGALKQTCCMVYLEVPPTLALERTAWGGERRPLLEVPDPTRAVKDMLRMRRPLYEKAADVTIDTTDRTIGQVVERIVEWWRQQK